MVWAGARPSAPTTKPAKSRGHGATSWRACARSNKPDSTRLAKTADSTRRKVAPPNSPKAAGQTDCRGPISAPTNRRRRTAPNAKPTASQDAASPPTPPDNRRPLRRTRRVPPRPKSPRRAPSKMGGRSSPRPREAGPATSFVARAPQSAAARPAKSGLLRSTRGKDKGLRMEDKGLQLKLKHVYSCSLYFGKDYLGF